MPTQESRDEAMLYVELWANKALELGLAIVSQIRAALAQGESRQLKIFRKSGLDNVKVGGLGFDLAKVGQGTGVTRSRQRCPS